MQRSDVSCCSIAHLPILHLCPRPPFEIHSCRAACGCALNTGYLVTLLHAHSTPQRPTISRCRKPHSATVRQRTVVASKSHELDAIRYLRYCTQAYLGQDVTEVFSWEFVFHAPPDWYTSHPTFDMPWLTSKYSVSLQMS